MSQFDLINVPSSNESVRVGNDEGNKVPGKFCSMSKDFKLNETFPFSRARVLSVVGVVPSSATHGKLSDSSLWAVHP
jgi:hypothetical protein